MVGPAETEAYAQLERRIRYRDAALAFEFELGRYLAGQLELNELAGQILKAVWDKADDAQRARMGSNDAWSAGAVGTDRAELRRVVDSGNLRERQNMIRNADTNHVFGELFGTPTWHQELTAEWDSQVRRDSKREKLTDLSPEKAVPPLSAAERRISVSPEGPEGRLLWWPGSSTREIKLSSPTQRSADATGGVVFAGTSNTTYVNFYVVDTLVKAGALPSVDWQKMRLLMLATMLPVGRPGHHTFHEVMRGAALAEEKFLGGNVLHYQDDWGRYRNLAPLTEEELRTHVAIDGRFPDEHALNVAPGQTVNDPLVTELVRGREAAQLAGATPSVGGDSLPLCADRRRSPTATGQSPSKPRGPLPSLPPQALTVASAAALRPTSASPHGRENLPDRQGLSTERRPTPAHNRPPARRR
ncbi:hypothetical protein [Streptomyces sp. NPDC049744]|uniref:hypothetical protein n=1 Tax=Streptomyces sp. NPDC049744 TaxID=3154359 RepID=UPI003426F4F7